jgi:hypothetical protein
MSSQFGDAARVRAPAKQDLGGRRCWRRRRTVTGRLLNGHEAFALETLEHRKRRR